MSEIPKKSKPISVRRYRIGDYAHYMGVGRDFLKHYEKCGLLSADHHDNGYRHFGFEQSSLILECMRLRNCGSMACTEIYSGEAWRRMMRSSSWSETLVSVT